MIDIDEAFEELAEHWSPRVIGVVNDSAIKIAKLSGEFIWHRHAAEDEAFIVVRGRLRLEFRDHQVVLTPGMLHVVPRGVEHRPVAEEETWVLLFEPTSTVKTGDAYVAE